MNNSYIVTVINNETNETKVTAAWEVFDQGDITQVLEAHAELAEGDEAAGTPVSHDVTDPALRVLAADAVSALIAEMGTTDVTISILFTIA